MSEINFRFDDVLREISAFKNICKDFIAPESAHVLPRLEDSLRMIQNHKSETVTPWGIRQDSPLRTRISEGEYEKENRAGRYRVYAEVTSKWEIFCPKQQTKKKTPQAIFGLRGIASTRVDIFWSKDSKKPELIAFWKTEIGDVRSPGCHFHISVLQDEHYLMFPKHLTVPRFPSILLTPCSVIEFVLAELFQTSWQQHAARPTSDMTTWRNVQLPRFEKLLAWHSKVFKESTTSPWTHLKARKPEPDLLLS